jgi:error-prone DNA polymerase
VHDPAAFTAGLLNAQPMGFWSPQSLVADAKRHGVVVRRPDVDVGRAVASLEPVSGPGGRDGGRGDGVGRTPIPPDAAAIRLGLSSVRGIGSDAATRIEAGAPWSGMEDLVRRAGLTRSQLEALATAGALDGMEGRRGSGDRRSLVWGAGAAAQATADRLPGVVTGAEPPPLPAVTPWEEVSDDLWSLGMAPDTTAMELARSGLDRRGVVRAAALAGRPAGDRVTVGGVVTHRQAPESAHGAVFLNLEDETGMVNIVCSRGAWVRWKPVARACPALLVRGRVERSEGSMTLVAERFEPLPLGPVPSSRDFR